MNLLLDTHLLLWAALGDSKLSKAAAAQINEPNNGLFFSAINIWEVVIKSSLGRPDFNVNPQLLRRRLLENGYAELQVSGEHVLAVANLPEIHRDPFDRVLIAQASVEGFTLLTADPAMASYPGLILKV